MTEGTSSSIALSMNICEPYNIISLEVYDSFSATISDFLMIVKLDFTTFGLFGDAFKGLFWDYPFEIDIIDLKP